MLFCLIIDDFTRFTNSLNNSKYNIEYQADLFLQHEFLLCKIEPDIQSSSSLFEDKLYFKTEEDMILFKLKYNL